ncbi:Hypothetical predicted protein [Cloeon dipterum]|uniref:Uncharacterized protein n=1 Tax=Cloeon dipterum TaxID=197152 RepID=A0A8S1DS58_9INSE|nr:Hypothetical predicted protein [Cloeon dipterum]
MVNDRGPDSLSNARHRNFSALESNFRARLSPAGAENIQRRLSDERARTGVCYSRNGETLSQHLRVPHFRW